MNGTVTVNDVAQKAGVSRRTVYDVLNGKESFVSQPTRDMVRKVAQELNYRPNYFAKSLKLSKTQTIGLMGGPTIADFNFPYIADVTGGIELAMARQQCAYSLIIFGANYHEGYEKNMELIKRGMADGLLVLLLSINTDGFRQNLLPLLQELQLPFVAIHSLSGPLGFNSVGVDSAHGMYLATKHLIGLGHRDIKFYVRSFQSVLEHEMYRGFCQALTESGLPVDASTIVETVGRRSVLTHYQDACQMALTMDPVPQAFVVSNDEQAMGLVHGFRARGLRVPGDVAVVGYNGSRPSPYFTDELTAVQHPIAQKTAAALNLLLDIMEGRKPYDQVYEETMQPWLEVRKTCGAGMTGTK
jgi:LacI family transcriptional regulator